MKLIPFLLVIVFAGLLFLPAGCSPRTGSVSTHEAPIVRVRLLENQERVSLSSTQPPVIVFGESRKQLGVRPGQTVQITCNGQQFLINGVPVGDGEMSIIPSAVGSVSVNSLPYRGSYRFVPLSNGRFDVVNDVDVDSYLMGVVSRELLPDWKLEAYKAQAIIARTYALYEARTGPSGRHWDLHTDERSQVYGGINGESDKSRNGVDATRGVVVAHGPTGEEKIFKAYFSSCCGGVSAAAQDAFGSDNIPPLSAHYNGNTCSIAGRYNWGPVTFTRIELARRIRAWGTKNGNSLAKIAAIRSIEIASVNQFNRPRQYVITDTSGTRTLLLAEQLRWAINTDPQGGPTIYSSFFRPVDFGDSIQLVEGHGFGHGVGACQWCMQARALGGESYEQIVLKAYPQSVVLQAY